MKKHAMFGLGGIMLGFFVAVVPASAMVSHPPQVWCDRCHPCTEWEHMGHRRYCTKCATRPEDSALIPASCRWRPHW